MGSNDGECGAQRSHDLVEYGLPFCFWGLYLRYGPQNQVEDPKSKVLALPYGARTMCGSVILKLC